jgi:hypothetical protein
MVGDSDRNNGVEDDVRFSWVKLAGEACEDCKISGDRNVGIAHEAILVALNYWPEDLPTVQGDGWNRKAVKRRVEDIADRLENKVMREVRKSYGVFFLMPLWWVIGGIVSGICSWLVQQWLKGRYGDIMQAKASTGLLN